MKAVLATEGAELFVPKTALNMGVVEADLTVYNEGFRNAFGASKKGAQECLQMWSETGPLVALPRGYLPKADVRGPRGAPADVYIKPHRAVRSECIVYVEKWDFRPPRPRNLFGTLDVKVPLRKSQVPAWEALLLAETRDKLLVLGCGKGKTLLALKYAAFRNRRTLILVDTDFILDQWADTIRRLFGYKPLAVTGVVKGDAYSIGDFFTIASVKTLVSRGMGEDFYDQFGLVVVDECHVMGAPTLQRILSMCQGERLGLTATHKRRDGMEKTYLYHLSGLEPTYMDVSRVAPCTWYFKEAPVTIPEILLKKETLARAKRDRKRDPAAYKKLKKLHCYREVGGKYMLQRPRFETYATASEEWFEEVCSELSRMAQAGRHVLALGGRVEHLTNLRDALVAKGVDAALVVGDVKGADRRAGLKSRVILATWQLAYKALNVGRLDTLVLFFPHKDPNFLQQASGRIDDREETGTKKPIVVVYEHRYDPSLARSGEAMRETLLDVDPSAMIRHVRPRK